MWHFGVYVYNKENAKDSNITTKKLAVQEQNLQESENTDSISTSVLEAKISPNCTIVEKKYYKGCDHLIKEIKEIPIDWINWTEEQIKEQYPDWEIESFSNNQIILSQEKEGFCPKHYVVRVHGDVLGIYILDEEGKETWKEDTEISTQYLPEEDLEKLQSGIKTVGDDKLHTVLEDFE